MKNEATAAISAGYETGAGVQGFINTQQAQQALEGPKAITGELWI